jgi:hypothetical protein
MPQDPEPLRCRQDWRSGFAVLLWDRLTLRMDRPHR